MSDRKEIADDIREDFYSRFGEPDIIFTDFTRRIIEGLIESVAARIARQEELHHESYHNDYE